MNHSTLLAYSANITSLVNPPKPTLSPKRVKPSLFRANANDPSLRSVVKPASKVTRKQ